MLDKEPYKRLTPQEFQIDHLIYEEPKGTF